jgi:hypothetical protein
VADFFGLQGVQQSASNVQGQQPNVNVTGGAGRVITNTQTLDSQLAADTLLGDDPLLQEIYRQRNT